MESEMLTTPPRAGVLDRPLLASVRLNWEVVAWVGLLVVAAVLRFVDLGVRAMSHDESLHTIYAYYLYDAGKYEHNPMMHGPLRYHVTALFYFLFGDSDATARLAPALLGIGLVGVVYLFRRYIGRMSALMAGVLVTISPSLLFHSRYIRDDIFIAFFLVVWVYGSFRYLEARPESAGRRWLLAVTLGMVFGILAMEAHFISGAIMGIFFVGLALWQVIEHRTLLAFAPVIFGFGFWYYFHKQDQDIIGAIGLLATVAVSVALVWNHIGATEWRKLRHNRAADLAIFMATLILPFTSPFIHLAATAAGVEWPEIDYQNPQNTATGVILTYIIVVLALAALSVALAWYWFGTRKADEEAGEEPALDFTTWAQMMILFWVIAILFYTTFLTNTRNGLASGIVGSLGYWLAQQKVERGSQPWYYYFFLTGLYEFLPFILSGAGMAVLVRSLLRIPNWDPTPATDLPPSIRSTAAKSDNEPSSIVQSPSSTTPSPATIRTYFVVFLAWWVVGAWVGFTVAGEKMPWLLTHMALPMCVFGGWALGRLIRLVDWGGALRTRAVWLIGIAPALIVVLAVLVWGGPTADRSILSLANTLQWVLGVGLAAGLSYLAWRWGETVGWATGWRLLSLGVLTLLFLLTVRASWRLTFINYDMATEYLVYAHASPDIKLALAEIDAISERTVGGRNIVVAYDNESSWPFSWYMRLYPNTKYYAENPNSDNMSAPVVIVGPKNYEKVHPYVMRDYVKRTYRLIWWPDMAYFNLTWGDVWRNITDPVLRKRNWEIFFYRRYRDVTPEGTLGPERDLAQWPHRHEFEMWVRRDLAAQIWDLGVAPAAAPVDSLEARARATELDLAASALYHNVYGDQALLTPRAVAVGPEGERVIVDSGNNRVVVLDAAGNFVRAFGSTCKLADNSGCVDPDGAGPLESGDGQFNEPWGVAVDQSGNIYVADTWNGRIQVFDREGNFLRKWGYFNTTNGELGDPLALFGPRGLAVDLDGNLLVADTGNKRILRYSPVGELIQQVGGGGVIGGRFEEPTSVAVSPVDGSVFVADAWNRRIQRLGTDLAFVAEYPVPSWDSRDIYMKPYVAAAPNGQLYVTDPQFFRVFIYDSNGELRANFGNFGSDLNRFGLPNGIAIDPIGGVVLVADANNNRVMGFPLVP
ncbi:MAG: hypothetical protein DCC55_10415 [Chloroflexi bacterium]|nr:MAG: hypothetical protein DCC55_10415 [Chloroflexota bacterium]